MKINTSVHNYSDLENITSNTESVFIDSVKLGHINLAHATGLKELCVHNSVIESMTFSDNSLKELQIVYSEVLEFINVPKKIEIVTIRHCSLRNIPLKYAKEVDLKGLNDPYIDLLICPNADIVSIEDCNAVKLVAPNAHTVSNLFNQKLEHILLSNQKLETYDGVYFEGLDKFANLKKVKIMPELKNRKFKFNENVSVSYY